MSAVVHNVMWLCGGLHGMHNEKRTFLMFQALSCKGTQQKERQVESAALTGEHPAAAPM